LSRSNQRSSLPLDDVEAIAQVTVPPQDSGFRMTKSNLVCEAGDSNAA